MRKCYIWKTLSIILTPLTASHIASWCLPSGLMPRARICDCSECDFVPSIPDTSSLPLRSFEKNPESFGSPFLLKSSSSCKWSYVPQEIAYSHDWTTQANSCMANMKETPPSAFDWDIPVSHSIKRDIFGMNSGLMIIDLRSRILNL